MSPAHRSLSAGSFLTISEIIDAAERTMTAELWDYASGGAGTEVTLRRNRTALERITFSPRVLRDVRLRDTSTTVLGMPLDLPVMVAPLGGVAEFDPDGALACARAAQAAGTSAWISSLSSPVLETVAETGAPLIFQLNGHDDGPESVTLAERALAAGYRGICVTVDTPVYSRRERDLRNRFNARQRKLRPNLTGARRAGSERSFTWEDVRALRDRLPAPLIIKGVLHPQDAAKAVDHGADALVVSNHGGRQLDGVPAPVEVLADVVDAVDGSAEILVDSGFLSGGDVAKAIALGACAVLIGKLACWSLAAGGSAVLARALELLREELSLTMALLGARTLADLDRDCVVVRSW